MTTVIPIKPAADVEITPENKCSFCRGSTCCTYFTQQIDTPRSIEDFDLLLWQIAHRDTQVYKDSDGWFLLINNPCTHLQPDGRCGIYESRPQICRDHSNDDCEFDGPAGADDFELYFDHYDALLAYCRKRFRNWDRRFKPPKTERKTASRKDGRSSASLRSRHSRVPAQHKDAKNRKKKRA